MDGILMGWDHERLRQMTRAELIRVIDEMRSERDAAKATALRAVEERNLAYDEVAMLRQRLATAPA